MAARAGPRLACSSPEVSSAPSWLELSSFLLTLAAGADMVLLRGRGGSGEGERREGEGGGQRLPLTPHARALARSGRLLPALARSLSLPLARARCPRGLTTREGLGLRAGPRPGLLLTEGRRRQAGRQLCSLTHAPRSSSLLDLPEPPPPPPPPHGEGRAAGRRRARPRAHAPPSAREARAASPLAGAPGPGGGAAARRHRAWRRGGRKERRDVRGLPPAPRSPPPLSPSPAQPGTFARYGRAAARGAGPRQAARRLPGGCVTWWRSGFPCRLGGAAERGVCSPPTAQAS